MNELINDLYENRLLRDEREMRQFIDAVKVFRENADIRYLPQLYLIFDDRAVNIPPYQSLLNIIDRFDDITSAKIFINMLPESIKQAQAWMKIIFLGFLANTHSRSYIKTYFHQATAEEKTAVWVLINAIRKDAEDEKQMPVYNSEYHQNVLKDIEFILSP